MIIIIRENGKPEYHIWNPRIPCIPPLLRVVDESCWVDLHNERTRDLQFTCLLHIHKGGGSELLSYGQTEQQLYGEQQVS